MIRCMTLLALGSMCGPLFVEESAYPPVPPFPLRGSGKETAFANDPWLSMVYQVDCRTAIRWGYQLMYLNGLGGFNDVNGLVGGSDDFAGSDAFLHGFHGALEWTF